MNGAIERQGVLQGFRLFALFGIMALVALLTFGCSDVEFSPDEGYEDFHGLDMVDEVLIGNAQRLSEGFVQTESFSKVDVLVVVDNSGSMEEEQEKMAQRIDSFLGLLSDVDWRLAITTTDVSSGRHGLKGHFLKFPKSGSRILHKDIPNFNSEFKQTVTRRESRDCLTNVCGSGDEQPLKAAMLAIKKYKNKSLDFFRDGADVALIVLSDEDEMSTGPVDATDSSQLLGEVAAAWGDKKRLSAYGIIVEPGDSDCFEEQRPSGGRYGTHVMDLVALTGGTTGSICDDDYGAALSRIGERARQLLDYVELQHQPLAKSLEILFGEQPVKDIKISGRRIYFSSPPPAGTKISVNYEVAMPAP